jgi:hypothetical protein
MGQGTYGRDRAPAGATVKQGKAGSNKAPPAPNGRGIAVVDMKLEVVVVPVSDVDKAKDFSCQ